MPVEVEVVKNWAQAIRRALQVLGSEAHADQIMAWCWNKLGIRVPRNNVHKYKSAFKKKGKMSKIKTMALTRTEAVLDALNNLGWSATTKEVQSYVRRNHQYEIGLNSITGLKAILKQKGHGPVPTQPEAFPPATPTSAEPEPVITQPTPSDLLRVYKALEAAGQKAGELLAFLEQARAQGLDLSTTTEGLRFWKEAGK